MRRFTGFETNFIVNLRGVGRPFAGPFSVCRSLPNAPVRPWRSGLSHRARLRRWFTDNFSIGYSLRRGEFSRSWVICRWASSSLLKGPQSIGIAAESYPQRQLAELCATRLWQNAGEIFHVVKFLSRVINDVFEAQIGFGRRVRAVLVGSRNVNSKRDGLHDGALEELEEFGQPINRGGVAIVPRICDKRSDSCPLIPDVPADEQRELVDPLLDAQDTADLPILFSLIPEIYAQRSAWRKKHLTKLIFFLNPLGIGSVNFKKTASRGLKKADRSS